MKDGLALKLRHLIAAFDKFQGFMTAFAKAALRYGEKLLI